MSRLMTAAQHSADKKRLHKAWHSRPASFAIRLSLVHLRNALSGGPKPLRILLVSDGTEYTSEQQFAPIFRNAVLLRERLGAVVQSRNFSSAMLIPSHRLSRFDLIGLKLSFRTPLAEAERLVQCLRNKLTNTSTKLVYFDGDDDINIQWPGILSMVDLYVKKHTFSDNNAYLSRYVGKSNLTDYIARNYGTSFSEDIIPASGGVKFEDLRKICLGWNIALDDKISDLIENITRMATLANDAAAEKVFDISCRVVSPNTWMYPLRQEAIKRIEGLSKQFRVIAPRERVPQDQYYQEMQRSRICVSPFGYGEICWRDFEAVACGCLLVKPDMGHVRTAPNIFLPEVTYAPVKWNYSDLEEKCAFYLQNEIERKAIVDRARKLLISSLQPDWFLAKFHEVLIRVGISRDLKVVDSFS